MYELGLVVCRWCLAGWKCVLMLFIVFIMLFVVLLVVMFVVVVLMMIMVIFLCQENALLCVCMQVAERG